MAMPVRLVSRWRRTSSPSGAAAGAGGDGAWVAALICGQNTIRRTAETTIAHIERALRGETVAVLGERADMVIVVEGICPSQQCI
jgi:hypothetical protein